jgi:hypothetical protein
MLGEMMDSEFEKKTYLGDSVYSEYDGYHIVLTTENGSPTPTNIIFLDDSVITNLIAHINRVSSYLDIGK